MADPAAAQTREGAKAESWEDENVLMINYVTRLESGLSGHFK